MDEERVIASCLQECVSAVEEGANFLWDDYAPSTGASLANPAAFVNVCQSQQLTVCNGTSVASVDTEDGVVEDATVLAKLGRLLLCHKDETRFLAVPTFSATESEHAGIPRNSECKSIAESFAAGCRLEVASAADSTNSSAAVILFNHGGRLLLKDESTSECQWLFCMSPRLAPLAHQHSNDVSAQGFKPSLFQVIANELNIADHELSVSSALEYYDVDSDKFLIAHISKIFDSKWFEVTINTDDGYKQKACNVRSAYLFPPTWGRKHGLDIRVPKTCCEEDDDFDWKDYCATKGWEMLPSATFVKDLPQEFRLLNKGDMLEVVNPHCPAELLCGTVLRVISPLLWVHTDVLSKPIVCDLRDACLFPCGFSANSGNPFRPPRLRPLCGVLDLNLPNYSCDKMVPVSCPIVPYMPKHLLPENCPWSPKIYINANCQLGPFLGRPKVQALPQIIGPGPLDLVLRRLLCCLLGASIRPREMLSELQCQNTTGKHSHSSTIKARVRGRIWRGQVNLCTSPSQLSRYCLHLCIRLQACPFLVALQPPPCPENCAVQATSTYVSKPKTSGDIRGELRKLRSCREELETQKLPVKEKNQHQGIRPSLFEAQKQLPRARKPRVLRFTRKKQRRKRPVPLQLLNFSHLESPPVKFARKDTEDSAPLTNGSSQSPYPFCAYFYANWAIDVNIPRVDSNPMAWSTEDLAEFLSKTDVFSVSSILENEEMDGEAFLLLNLETAVSLLNFQLGTAVKLCCIVEKLKRLYFEVYC